MAADISIAAEPVLHLGTLTVTNSMLMAVIITVILTCIAIWVRSSLRPVPKTGQNIFELIYTGFIDISEKVTGNRDVARDLFPFIISAFLFIVLSNWSGLLPVMGSILVHHGEHSVPLLRAPTADLNTVIALALCTVVMVQYLGIKYRGAKGYLHTFFNFSSPIYFFVGILELIAEFTRIISYSFRLFGNVFAGEVLISVILFLTISLAPVFPILPLPFYFLEMFVGVIQGLVFCFLTIVFAGIATADHGDGHSEPHAKAAVSA